MDEQKWTPQSLLKLSGMYWQTLTLHAAVKLGIFTLLDGEAWSSEDVASGLKANPRATGMLLNALCSMDLLEKKKGGYRNTDVSFKFLSKNSSFYIGYMILHHHQLVDSWNHLSEAIMSGKPVRERTSYSDESSRENFLMGMFNSAMQMAESLVKTVDLSGKRNLLDLGGGPGTYAVHFCRQYEELSATVFDLPTTRPFAEKVIREFGMDGRIQFQEGDFVSDSIKGEYDVAFLSHILHGEGPYVCRQIIEKVAKRLKPSGMIVIHEFILKDSMDGPLFPALFSMNMLLGTENGQSYTESELKEMLRMAGARNIERSPYNGPTQSGILTAIF